VALMGTYGPTTSAQTFALSDSMLTGTSRTVGFQPQHLAQLRPIGIPPSAILVMRCSIGQEITISNSTDINAALSLRPLPFCGRGLEASKHSPQFSPYWIFARSVVCVLLFGRRPQPIDITMQNSKVRPSKRQIWVSNPRFESLIGSFILLILMYLYRLVAPQGFTTSEISIRYAGNRRFSPQHSPHKKIFFCPLISGAFRRTFWDGLG
jgi:hypothetical protein